MLQFSNSSTCFQFTVHEILGKDHPDSMPNGQLWRPTGQNLFFLTFQTLYHCLGSGGRALFILNVWDEKLRVFKLKNGLDPWICPILWIENTLRNVHVSIFFAYLLISGQIFCEVKIEGLQMHWLLLTSTSWHLHSHFLGSTLQIF